MAKFAVIENELILNIIEADSKEIAESATGHTCIEFTDEPAGPGGRYVNGVFIQVQPYPSWVLNQDNIWEAPVPTPTEPGPWRWDEDSTSWVKLEK